MANTVVLSLKELKKQVDDIMTSLSGLENGTSKYNNLLDQSVGTLDQNVKLLAQQKDQLQGLNNLYKAGVISQEDFLKQQREVKIAMQDNNKIINIQQKLANDSNMSYRDMSDTLSLLKNAYKNLSQAETQTAEGKEMLKHIQTLDQALKNMDKTMGENFRNVGNYSSAFDGVSKALGQLGISTQALGPAFGAASLAAGGFKSILDTLKAHPIIAALGVLLGIFMKLKDAIGKNEELSKRWSKAMSAFQPIINAISNAMDWLADKLVSVMEWVSEALPTGLRKFGDFAKGVTNLAGNILDVMLFVPRQIVKAYTWMNEKIIDGLKWVIDGVGDLLDMVGLDVGAKMKSWTTYISNIAKSSMNGINDLMSNAGNYIKNAGIDMSNALEKAAKSAEYSMKITRDAQKLDEDRRKQEIETEKSLLKQQELRNKIAEASGEEKKKLLQQLKNEIEQTGEKELEIARRTLELEKKRRELAPNSREDNIHYEELQKNLIRVEAATSAATVRINKQITSTTEKLTADAAKAAKAAEQQAHKDSLDIVKEVKTTLDEVKAETEHSIAELESVYKESQELGLATLQDQQNYEDQRHSIIVDGIKKQKVELEKALKNQKLLPQERLNLEILVMNKTNDLIKEETRHRINNNKIWLEDRKKTLVEAQRLERMNEVDRDTNITKAYTDGLTKLSEQYAKGEIDYFDFQKRLTNIQREEEQRRLDEQVRSTGMALKQYEVYMNEVSQKFGDNSDEAREAFDKYNEALDANTKAVEARKQYSAKMLLEDTNNHKDYVKQQINIYQTLAKSIGDIFGKIAEIMEENLNKKLENGEIEEEEAKKEFDRIKALQISEAVVNTISGATGAFMKDMSTYAFPYNYAIAAADLATTIATGVAQIQKISNTTFGSSSVDGSSSSGSIAQGISVMPLLDERADYNTLQQLQTESAISNTQTDQRVYILESDIIENNKKVQLREQNSSF